MPLFMCLSGYLYDKYTQITDKKDYFKFVMKKIINLGIPYIFFYVAYVLINMMFSSNVNSNRSFQDILNIFTNPISPFWFLYALTVIFILIPIIEKILKNKYEIIFCILTFFFVLSLYFKTKIYAIDIFAQYAVYFYFGVILVKKIQIKNKKIFPNTFVNSVIFIFLAIMCCSIKKYNILNSSIISLFKLILAFYAIIIIINIFKNVEKNKYFDIILKYTFPIYLMHTTFSAGIRIVLLKIGINNFYIHFILGLLFGITIPIVISYILKITKYGNILLYPLNTMKEIKESKNENSNDRS